MGKRGVGFNVPFILSKIVVTIAWIADPPQYKIPHTEGREGALYEFTYQIIFSFHA